MIYVRTVAQSLSQTYHRAAGKILLSRSGRAFKLNKPATYLILYTNIESIYIYARRVSIMGSMCLDPPSDSRHAASFRFRMSESRALHVRNYERSEADLFHFRAVMRVTLESEKVGWVAAKSIG